MPPRGQGRQTEPAPPDRQGASHPQPGRKGKFGHAGNDPRPRARGDGPLQGVFGALTCRTGERETCRGSLRTLDPVASRRERRAQDAEGTCCAWTRASRCAWRILQTGGSAMRPITPSGTRTLPLVLALVAATLLLPLASTASAATLSARATVNASQGRGTHPATPFGINTAVYDSLMNDAPVAGLMRSAGVKVM